MKHLDQDTNETIKFSSGNIHYKKEKNFKNGKVVDSKVWTYDEHTKELVNYHREMYDDINGKIHYYRHIAYRKTDGKKTYDKKKEYEGTNLRFMTIYEYDYNNLKEINFEYYRYKNNKTQYYKIVKHDKNGKEVSRKEWFRI